MNEQERKELIKYVTVDGGLYLWDNTPGAVTSSKWDFIPKNFQTDWKIFFDQCKENPRYHTESLVEAIQKGLAPFRERIIKPLKGIEWFSRFGRDYEYETIWYFVGKGEKFTDRNVPEIYGGQAPQYFLGSWHGFRLCVSCEEAERLRLYSFRKAAEKVWRFTSLPKSWNFLLSQI